jgi:hypothetical protein
MVFRLGQPAGMRSTCVDEISHFQFALVTECKHYLGWTSGSRNGIPPTNRTKRTTPNAQRSLDSGAQDGLEPNTGPVLRIALGSGAEIAERCVRDWIVHTEPNVLSFTSR